MELLIKSLIISLVCVGLRIMYRKGMVLHFLRKPYEYLQDKTIQLNRLCKWRKYIANRNLYKRYLIIDNLLILILKPFVGCIICFASVYTIIMEIYAYNGLNKATPIIMLIVVTLNSIIYGIYEKYGV